jgi:hypothetical protein
MKIADKNEGKCIRSNKSDPFSFSSVGQEGLGRRGASDVDEDRWFNKIVFAVGQLLALLISFILLLDHAQTGLSDVFHPAADSAGVLLHPHQRRGPREHERPRTSQEYQLQTVRGELPQWTRGQSFGTLSPTQMAGSKDNILELMRSKSAQ